MSIQAAQDFRQQTNASPALQAEVARHFNNGSIDYAALAELGRKHGHDFSAEDAVAVLSTPSDELSDFEMELVSGGIIMPSYMSTKHNRPMGG
ncbi:Nif11 family protein [Massilia solisilvae]|uniref:Nif11 family protein n=1 Tax=Massilia solisilvae TaxID=1811225 RepID=A0ABT2BN59_9BURK|nr:Nif11 family protein [Massilia solisilvae]MCS0609958.1 Nif11 family protein [Massilia solisilvae]